MLTAFTLEINQSSGYMRAVSTHLCVFSEAGLFEVTLRGVYELTSLSEPAVHLGFKHQNNISPSENNPPRSRVRLHYSHGAVGAVITLEGIDDSAGSKSTKNIPVVLLLRCDFVSACQSNCYFSRTGS